MRGANLFSSVWLMPHDFMYDVLTTKRDSDFPDKFGTRTGFYTAYELYVANINGSGE